MIDATALPRRAGLRSLFGACLALICALGVAPAYTAGGAPSASTVRAAPDTRSADSYLEVQRLMRAGDSAAALARLEAITPDQAREPRWRFARGVLLAEVGRSQEAVEVYTTLTQEFPELAEPYNNLAVLRAAQGRLDEARAALETALRLDPTHREARENLGEVYVRLAVRLWESLGPAPGRREPDADLARKLRLAREIGMPAR